MTESQEKWARALLEPSHAPRGTQAIRRAFLVLRVIALGRENGCGLSEVSSACGLSRPTVRRIITALIAEGIVGQDPRTKRYRAHSYSEILGLLSHTSPLLREVNLLLDEAAREIGDNVSLTVRSGMDTVCVARRLGSYPIQVMTMGIGVRRAIGVSSSSIAILATLPRQEAQQIVRENCIRLDKSAADTEEIMNKVEQAKECGYAFREHGLAHGTRALSVPICSGTGAAYATLTVTAIARRIPRQRVNSIVEALQRCAAKMAELISHTLALF